MDITLVNLHSVIVSMKTSARLECIVIVKPRSCFCYIRPNTSIDFNNLLLLDFSIKFCVP